jgi:NTE family protein
LRALHECPRRALQRAAGSADIAGVSRPTAAPLVKPAADAAPARRGVGDAAGGACAGLVKAPCGSALDAQLGADLDAQLDADLRALLGDGEAALCAALRERLQAMELPAGATLMRQGEAGDALYLVLGGRLRVWRGAAATGAAVVCAELGRGEIVGELALLGAVPRAASVSAWRNTRLARLARADFDALQQAHPGLTLALARLALRRLQAPAPRRALAPATVALVPVDAGVDAQDFAQRLAAALRRAVAGWRVAVVHAGQLDGGPGADAAARARHRAQQLARIEAAHEQVLLVGDAGAGTWTRACLDHADEVLWLADAQRPPCLHPLEERPADRPADPPADCPDGGAAAGRDVLVLLHPAWQRSPRGTRAWLALRPHAEHLHLRPDLARDMARLARLQSRTALGLVLAGGGARGFAHLGVWQALREHGVEVDCVGGTSIGAVMATYVACGQPPGHIEANLRRAFASRPTGDFSALPLLSLFKGRRLQRTVGDAVRDLLGFDADVEDLWLTHYSVATNVTRGCAQLIRRGSLVQALLASVAVPGVLPPVPVDGDLLCDGGLVDNFPVAAMRGLRGVGRVIGVDLDRGDELRVQRAALPSGWALLRDRLRRAPQRRYADVPTLAAYLHRISVLHSSARQHAARAQADWCIQPPLGEVGLLDWQALDAISARGYRHACALLAAGQGLGGALGPCADSADSIPPES